MSMKQIFLLGSSSVYGVGAEQAGWADLVKQYVHSKMYSNGGVGEKYEVYNFGKSGATIDFVIDNFPKQLEQYGRDVDTTVIVCVGGNNSKAETTPDNFVSTPEEYAEEVKKLLKLLKENSKQIIVVGNGWVDESKTTPKPNPLTGGKSYMTNARRKQFSEITKSVAKEHGVSFVDVDVSYDDWIDNYIYEDGLHPNQEGHKLIFEEIKKVLSL